MVIATVLFAFAVLISLLSIAALQYEETYKSVVVPVLVGLVSSLVATAGFYCLTELSLDRLLGGRKVRLLRTEAEVYAEAARMIDDLAASSSPKLRNVQMTALVRKETTESSPSEIGQYLKSLNKLLSAATEADDLSYNLLGDFGRLEQEQGVERLVGFEEDLEARLGVFETANARKRVNIKTFNEAWPVDMLKIRDEAIIGFRDHDSGGLMWGLRISDNAGASKVWNWLEDLWQDENRTILLVRHGKQIYPSGRV